MLKNINSILLLNMSYDNNRISRVSLMRDGDDVTNGNILNGLTLPTPATVIEPHSFSQLMVKKLTIIGDIETIGDRAFENNQWLESITIKSISGRNTIKYIGVRAFGNCKKLKEINLVNIADDCESKYSQCYDSNVEFINEKHMSLFLRELIPDSAPINKKEISPEKSKFHKLFMNWDDIEKAAGNCTPGIKYSIIITKNVKIEFVKPDETEPIYTYVEVDGEDMPELFRKFVSPLSLLSYLLKLSFEFSFNEDNWEIFNPDAIKLEMNRI